VRIWQLIFYNAKLRQFKSDVNLRMSILECWGLHSLRATGVKNGASLETDVSIAFVPIYCELQYILLTELLHKAITFMRFKVSRPVNFLLFQILIILQATSPCSCTWHTCNELRALYCYICKQSYLIFIVIPSVKQL
jgi:hypothetical protein